MRTDTLAEGVLALVRCHPLQVFLLPFWLIRGKAYLKRQVVVSAELEVQLMPANTGLVEFLRKEQSRGRRLVLATGADGVTARLVAERFGFFSEVMATDGLNLTGKAKRDALVARFGLRGFDYVGDSAEDGPVFAACRMGHAAGKLRALPREVLQGGTLEGPAFHTNSGGAATWVRALRIHQWIKNILVVVPTLLNHRLDWALFQTLLITFGAFCMVGSGTYILNDLFDVFSDRKHPRKKRRPFASGQLDPGTGVAVATLLLVFGLGTAAWQAPNVAACLVTYMALSASYSTWVKNKPILDAVVLAVLYLIRLYTGGIVSQAWISPWLFQFLIFLFLSLAFAKRYSELGIWQEEDVRETPGRGYRLGDMSVVSQAGVTAGMVAGLVLALYFNSQEVQRLYPKPHMLLPIVPLYLYWIVRVWLVAHRGNLHEDPVIFAFRDKVSYIVALGIVVSALLAMFGPGFLTERIWGY